MTIPTLGSARLLVLAAACCLSLSTAALAQPEPAQDELRSVRALYEADKWTKGAARDGFPLGSLELEGWSGGPLRSDSGHMHRKFTAAGKREKPEAILIEAFVADSVDRAQQQLLIWLAGRQAPDAAPRVQDRNLKIGDVGYLGLSGAERQTIAWIAFVKGNIAVRVRNADTRSQPALDLAAIVRTLDEKISSRPALAENAKPPVPTIAKFASEKQEATAGEVVRLDVTITDPARGTPHIQWVVGGPGQGYVEAKKDGDWYLHTTGAGQISLSLQVTASTGTFTSKQIKIAVRPNKK